MSKLAHWTYCSFREDGQFLKDIEARAAAERLVKELDKDGDGNISFKEFVEYFEMKEKEAQSYHDSVLKTSGDHTNAHNYFSEDETFVMPPMSAAYTKFLELDDDLLLIVLAFAVARVHHAPVHTFQIAKVHRVFKLPCRVEEDGRGVQIHLLAGLGLPLQLGDDLTVVLQVQGRFTPRTFIL